RADADLCLRRPVPALHLQPDPEEGALDDRSQLQTDLARLRAGNADHPAEPWRHRTVRPLGLRQNNLAALSCRPFAAATRPSRREWRNLAGRKTLHAAAPTSG